jgi:ArsR family transcriptional regulator, arsenate/arsenite/antimonite-responsive transcriptional repressor
MSARMLEQPRSLAETVIRDDQPVVGVLPAAPNLSIMNPVAKSPAPKSSTVRHVPKAAAVDEVAAQDTAAADPSFPELPDQLEKDLVQVFKLLADETRLRILMYLMRQGELHVTALCEKLQQSQPAVSHHLALLRVAGLIEARRDGKHNYYSVRSRHFHRIVGELFSSMTEPDGDSLRFQGFILSQDDKK